ncbi:hypothetical protein BJX63DRAFT_62520 [Aspergillus granulosus]|uniref:Uncharacterized protein n=1 Tax=Aspergillus granulosus TaxID=176169 RepID=A0ABR4GWW5_9EURO
MHTSPFNLVHRCPQQPCNREIAIVVANKDFPAPEGYHSNSNKLTSHYRYKNSNCPWPPHLQRDVNIGLLAIPSVSQHLWQHGLGSHDGQNRKTCRNMCRIQFSTRCDTSMRPNPRYGIFQAIDEVYGCLLYIWVYPNTKTHIRLVQALHCP